MTRDPRRRTARALAAGTLVAGVVAALAACGDGSAPPGYGGISPTASPTPDDEGTGADGPTADAPFPADAAVDTAEPSDDAALVVTDVRAGPQDGFDRVVFDLAGTGSAGWRVEYVDAAADDGSGEPVEVAGDAVLQVRLAGMAMPTEDPDVVEYDGGTVGPQGTSSVEEVVYRFWFEGYTTAFVGVDGGSGAADPPPFRVFALEDPARVVVDVQHAPDD